MPGFDSNQPTGLTQRAVSGTAWSTFATIAKQLLSLASMATVARVLGPGAYGLMGMAALVIALVVMFRDLGTASAIVQRPSVSSRMLSSLFWVNLAIGLTVSGAVFATAPLIADFFHAADVKWILRALTLSLLFASCGVVQNALLMRLMHFKAIAAVDTTSALISYLSALLSACAGLGVWSLVIANIVGSLVSTLGYWIACSTWRPSFGFDLAEIQSVMHFSLNLSGFGVVNYASRNADNLIIGKALGSVPLGYYQMAYNLMLAPIQNVSSVISQVVYPAFARIQSDNERFRSAYVRSCALIGLFTFPIMSGLAVIADPLVRVLLGAKWLGAVLIFQVLAPVGLLQSVQTTVGQIYTAKNRTDWMFRWGLASSVVLVTAFLCGVHYGALGVAIAYSVAYLGVIAYPCFAIPFRLIDLRVRDFARVIWPQIAVTALMTVVCIVWLGVTVAWHIGSDWTRITSTCSLGVLAYLAGLAAAKPPVLYFLSEVITTSENKVVRRGLEMLSMQPVRDGRPVRW